MKKYVVSSLLITSAGLIAPLSTAEETPTVNVGDFEIIPMGDLGNFSSWDIHPKALVGTGYDSNIFGEENNTDSDLFLRGIAGITTRWNSQQTAEVTANAEYETKQFIDSKNDGADFNGGTVEVLYENEGLLNTITAHLGWIRADDPTISTGETLATSTLTASAGYRHEGLNDTYSLGGLALDTDYLEDGRNFDAEERDRTQFFVDGTYGRAINEGEYWYVRGQFESSTYATNRTYSDSWAFGVTGGAPFLGDRANLIAEAG